MSEWRNCKLGEILELKRGYDLPNRFRIEGKYPIVSSGGKTGTHIESKVKGPGVITGRYGTIGKIFFEKEEYWPLNTTLYVKDFKGNNPLFIYYFLHLVDFESCSDKAAVPGVNRNHLHLLDAKIPPLPEQKAIAHILGTLDEKIELNRQMNQTLEAMAQALFKSWFVDFDPVIDNALAAGNKIPEELQARAEKRRVIAGDVIAREERPWQSQQPKTKRLIDTNPSLATQFPASFVFNETLGKWIPKGWEVKTIGDLANVSSAKRIFANEYKTLGIPFFRGKEITLLSQGSNFEPEIFISKERFSELKIKHGVPGKDDILLTSVGTIGNTYLVEEEDEFYFKDGNLTWFTNYQTEIGGKYLKTWFESEEAKLAIENIKIGSTQQAITITSINSINLILAHELVLKEFNRHIDNFITERQKKVKETKTLTKFRDTLLPELISGRVRLEEDLK